VFTDESIQREVKYLQSPDKLCAPFDLEEAINPKETNDVQEFIDHTEAFNREKIIEREPYFDLVESNDLEDSSKLKDSEMSNDQKQSILSIKLLDRDLPVHQREPGGKNKSIHTLMLAMNVDEKHRKELRTILNKTSQGHLAEYLSNYECKLVF